MSHQPGTDLGGIRTLEGLRVRCRLDDETGCWLWALKSDCGHPKPWIRLPNGTRKRMTGTRAAVFLSTGKMVPQGKQAYRKCCALLCVNPEHIRVGTREQIGAHHRREGIFKGQPTRIAANTLTVRSRPRTKLTLEKAREIRSSDLASGELSAIYGVPASHIRAIRQGKAWREGFAGNSVFNLAA